MSLLCHGLLSPDRGILAKQKVSKTNGGVRQVDLRSRPVAWSGDHAITRCAQVAGTVLIRSHQRRPISGEFLARSAGRSPPSGRTNSAGNLSPVPPGGGIPTAGSHGASRASFRVVFSDMPYGAGLSTTLCPREACTTPGRMLRVTVWRRSRRPTDLHQCTKDHRRRFALRGFCGSPAPCRSPSVRAFVRWYPGHGPVRRRHPERCGE